MTTPTPRVEFGVQIGDKVEQHTASGFAFGFHTAKNRADYINDHSFMYDPPAYVVTRQVSISEWAAYVPAEVAS